MSSKKKIAVSSLAALLLIVIIQNSAVVSVRFLFWKLSISQVILFLILVLTGVLIGFFIGRKSWDW